MVDIDEIKYDALFYSFFLLILEFQNLEENFSRFQRTANDNFIFLHGLIKFKKFSIFESQIVFSGR